MHDVPCPNLIKIIEFWFCIILILDKTTIYFYQNIGINFKT
ncbi:hypothetical protein NEISUBOT_04735 [Neisseria subflava NJ9703]|uniref:Uncharacterized protein n=1 Tax=Neisseria subflava NJ9703 TaxID=546268 RepID=A0A9W5IQ45_NEISU|nr:hypothetical protein NEISUBOT_04735 [Neisseria subflava NJ9703]